MGSFDLVQGFRKSNCAWNDQYHRAIVATSRNSLCRPVKMRALEALAKHFGLVAERLEVSGWDKLAAQLNHARTVGPTAST
jgi:hypothetical protein